MLIMKQTYETQQELCNDQNKEEVNSVEIRQNSQLEGDESEEEYYCGLCGLTHN